MKIIRRSLLVLGLAVTVLGGLAFAQRPDVTFIMDNNRASSWLVLSVEGAEGVAELRTDNPTLTLEVGKRYMFDMSLVNNIFHPFDIRDAGGNMLLAQGLERGTFEQDPAVAFSTDEDTFAFTLTPELADAMFTYHCTIHEAMVGAIGVTGQ